MEKKPTIISKKVVYDGFFSVREDEICTEKERGTYTVFSTKTRAAIILAQYKNKFLVNYEYRHGAQDYIWGLPGGRVEPSEDMESGVKRELLEETGFRANSVKLMGISYSIPSICDQALYFYYSDDVEYLSKHKLDAFEYLDTHFLTEEELSKIIKGKDVDSSLLSAIYYYKCLRMN